MREISLFVTFFSFFRFSTSPGRLTDFDDLYVKMRGFAQGSAFSGLDDNLKCLGAKSPKTPIFGPRMCSECCRTLNRKEQLRHRAVSLRQHGFLVYQ